MATILTPHTFRAVDLNGIAVPGALATFYNSGTMTPRTVYADPECTVPHPAPMIASGAGVFAQVFDTGGGDAKAIVTTPGGAMLPGYPLDPVARVSTNVAGAESVSFDPTPEIPVTTVQRAIERVQENILDPLADFGLGVTGNASIIADIDATGTASGAYRFDGTTIGAFPAGVTASAGGIVRVWRESSSKAIMMLVATGATRHHIRALNGTWVAWRRLMSDADTVTEATWRAGVSTTPAVISPADARAAASGIALGEGQAWQNVTGSRNAGTWYTNNTGRTITVSIYSNTAAAALQVRATPSAPINTLVETFNFNQAYSTAIPAGTQYRINGGGFINWSECR